MKTAFVGTYDLKETNPKPHSEFINQAAKLGWSPWIRSDNGTWYRLPNTTLVGEFVDVGAAEQALLAARAATQAAIGVTVTLEKWIISVRGASRFSSDVQQKAA